MVEFRHLKNKTNVLFILTIVIFSFLPLFQYFDSYEHFAYHIGDVDIGNFISTNQIVIKDSIVNYGQFPLWNIYTLAGTPLFAGPQIGVFSLTTLIDLFTPTSYAAVKLSLFIYYLIAGLSMYFLMKGFGLKPKFAFVSALVYMVNGTAAYFIFSYTFWSAAYAFLPLIILFSKKALESKEWIIYSILAGLLLGFVFLSGAVSGFLYCFMFFSLFIFFNLFGKKRFKKTILIGLVTTVICVGILAVKALPSKEFVDLTYRSSDFSYDFFLGSGHHMDTGNIGDYLIKKEEQPFPTGYDGSGQIGFVALALVLLSIPLFKKKKILFFQLVLIFVIIYMMRSPISWLVWKFVPVFNQQKNLDKALFLYNICAAALAGWGTYFLFKKIKSAFKVSKKVINTLFVVLIAVFLIEMGFLNLFAVMFTGDGFNEDANDGKFGNYYNMKDDIQSNRIMQEMARDDSLFRFKYDHVNEPYGGANSFNVPLGLQEIYGNGNVYHGEYPILGMVAEQQNKRSKLYGILNLKYLISHEKLDYAGFDLVGEFDPVKDSFYSSKKISYGPYLYQNNEFLPRAYYVDNSILVIGIKPTQIIYGLMIDERFNPANSVIVHGGENLNDYSAEELNRYSAIFLTEGINNRNVLQKYSGVVIPNILEGKTSITEDAINEMFDSFTDNDVQTAEISYYSPNKVILNTDRTGFLVVSEKYAMFPGWKAMVDGKETAIQRADGVISTVYVDAGTVEFKYAPIKFALGLGIFFIVIVFACSYIIYKKIKEK